MQLVNLRLTAIGRFKSLELAHRAYDSGNSLKGHRDVWFPHGELQSCQIHEYEKLDSDSKLSGPAILEAIDTTIIVPPTWLAKMNDSGHILMETSQ